MELVLAFLAVVDGDDEREWLIASQISGHIIMYRETQSRHGSPFVFRRHVISLALNVNIP